MRIHIASDLHLEFSRGHLLEPLPAADLLVLAGDIGVGTQAIQAFRNWPTPVLYVPGNHESYGGDLNETLYEIRRASVGTAVQVLNNDTALFDGVRFLGTTLWTDYELHGASQSDFSMRVAEKQLWDHQEIRHERGRFTAQHALGLHKASRLWLQEHLLSPHMGPTVVISHHGPHPRSVHPRYAQDALNPAFNSDLTPLLGHAHLWIHGHVHDSFDYIENGCRVVANPRGYPRNWKTAQSPKELSFENQHFDPGLVVEVQTNRPLQ